MLSYGNPDQHLGSVLKSFIGDIDRNVITMAILNQNRREFDNMFTRSGPLEDENALFAFENAKKLPPTGRKATNCKKNLWRK